MKNDKKRFERYKNELLSIIHKKLPLCTVYLFGSRARKTNAEGADIDLALDAKHPIDLTLLLKLYGEIEETTIPLTVDLVDLHSASDTLKKVIQKEGILWTK